MGCWGGVRRVEGGGRKGNGSLLAFIEIVH